MNHLRNHILLLRVRSLYSPPSSSLSPLSPLHRLLSSTAASIPANPFAAEDYMVATCGLTRDQARKAAKKLSRLRSPSKPDAVLAFLSGLGLSRSDIAAAVAADPRLLCADVEKNLAKRVAELGELGISRSQIARLIPLARTYFRSRSLATTLGFWLPVFGSFDEIIKAIRWNFNLLSSSVEKVGKPNLAFLEQCGINACAVASSSTMYSSRLLTTNPKYLRDVVARVEELGLDRSSKLFERGVTAVAFISKEAVARKTRLLEGLGFSQDDFLLIIRKLPQVLELSENKIRRAVEFFKRDVGLEERYIVQRPALFLYSLERRLLPRYYLLQVLKAKGLLNREMDYCSTVKMGKKKFADRFINPYKYVIPGLANAYDTSCSGKAANGVASLLGL